MFNYRLFCDYRPRKFVITGQIGTTKKHLPEVTVEVRAQAVHTKTYQTEILFAPVECPVEMTLCLGARINCAGSPSK